MRVEKPWGYEDELQATDRYSVWKLHINAGHETSYHCHSIKDVFLTCQTGVLRVDREKQQDFLYPGDTLVIDRGTYHRLQSTTGATVLEVEWPNDRNDITRKEDRYGRASG